MASLGVILICDFNQTQTYDDVRPEKDEYRRQHFYNEEKMETSEKENQSPSKSQ